MSINEVATILGTTPGAVKAALHRGRGRLKESAPATHRRLPSAAVVDRFVERYNAHDLPGLVGLMLDSSSVEMFGVNNEFGREGFRREHGWFFHAVMGFPDAFKKPESRWQRCEFRGEPLVLQFITIDGREVLTSLLRLETEGEMVARVRSYTFCPDAVREVGNELGLPVGRGVYSLRQYLEVMKSAGGEPDIALN